MSPMASSKLKGFKTMNGGSILNFHNSELSDNGSSALKYDDKQNKESLNRIKAKNTYIQQTIDRKEAVEIEQVNKASDDDTPGKGLNMALIDDK